MSFAGSQQIVRLARTNDQVAKGLLLTTSVSDAAKFQERIDERGNHEMLFANRAVLCEGKDDYFAVRDYLQKSDFDMDGRSVSILDVGSAQNIPAYATMAGALGIPGCGLTDEDKDAAGVVNPVTAKVRTKLGQIKSASDLVLSWPGNLEASLGITVGKATPDWQQANLSQRALDQTKSSFPDYASTCEAIMHWAST